MTSILLLLCCCGAADKATDGAGDADAAKGQEVAAVVGKHSIRVREVERAAAEALGKQPAAGPAKRVILAAALQRLVDQRLALNYLQRRNWGASAAEVDRELQQIKDRLKRKEIAFEKYLQTVNMKEPELRDALKWKLSWRAFLKRFLTEDNLKTHYRRNKRDFDGTQVRVAHLLLKPKEGVDQADLEQEAKRILADVRAGKQTFAAAAKRFSQSPSAAKGGDIGWIRRREPMPESFSRAAFALKVGEVGGPVVTAYGVHLLKCVEVKNGQKPWDQIRPELEKAVARYLFSWAADQVRSETALRYTGASPYFDPKSGRRVVVGQAVEIPAKGSGRDAGTR